MPNRRSKIAISRIESKILSLALENNIDLNSVVNLASIDNPLSNLNDREVGNETQGEISQSPFTSPSMPVLDDSLSSFAFKMEM